MKLITRDTDYAVRAVVYIAAKGEEVVSVPELMDALKIPRPFLRKILQMLTHGGILDSYKGSGGGFTLRKKVNQIRLTDIMEVFQGPVVLNECLFKKKICPNRPSCMLRKKIEQIERYAALELGSVVISDLI